MTRREFARAKRRINCNLMVDGTQYLGVVRDLSPKGFFVQTHAKAPVGSRVVVHLHLVGGNSFELQATVASRRETPRRLAVLAHAGIGCQLSAPAPEGYYHFLADITGS
ncbi:MAG: PilZ domain-containing protein [Proteobacteria bacterium]|nr:PilZ domain-containing protein [Pseudomonadota bacterium]